MNMWTLNYFEDANKVELKYDSFMILEKNGNKTTLKFIPCWNERAH